MRILIFFPLPKRNTLKFSRSEVIVSFPLESSHFKALPEDLRNGALIYLHPVVFNVGINEHATIAERYVLARNFSLSVLSHEPFTKLGPRLHCIGTVLFLTKFVTLH